MEGLPCGEGWLAPEPEPWERSGRRKVEVSQSEAWVRSVREVRPAGKAA